MPTIAHLAGRLVASAFGFLYNERAFTLRTVRLAHYVEWAHEDILTPENYLGLNLWDFC